MPKARGREFLGVSGSGGERESGGGKGGAAAAAEEEGKGRGGGSAVMGCDVGVGAIRRDGVQGRGVRRMVWISLACPRFVGEMG